jgi:hypothetical protein
VCSEAPLAYANQLILPVCPPLAVLVACALRVLRAHVLPWGVRAGFGGMSTNGESWGKTSTSTSHTRWLSHLAAPTVACKAGGTPTSKPTSLQPTNRPTHPPRGHDPHLTPSLTPSLPHSPTPPALPHLSLTHQQKAPSNFWGAFFLLRRSVLAREHMHPSPVPGRSPGRSFHSFSQSFRSPTRCPTNRQNTAHRQKTEHPERIPHPARIPHAFIESSFIHSSRSPELRLINLSHFDLPE